MSDEHCGHDLLTEIGLTPSDGGEEHVADGTAGEPVEAATGGGHGDDEQGLGASVVSAVDDCCCGETTCDLQFSTASACLSYTPSSLPNALITSLAHLS